MSTSPPAGWYPDPGDSRGLRWWDGQRWTEHAQPPPVAAPVAGSAGPVTPGTPYPTWPDGSPSAGNPGPYVPNPGYYGPAKPQNPNRYAFITFGVVALYLVLAIATGIAFIGIVPIMMSIRSKSRNEPLAYFAIGAAVLSFIVSLSVLAHR